MIFYTAIIIGFFIGFSSAAIVLWWVKEHRNHAPSGVRISIKQGGSS